LVSANILSKTITPCARTMPQMGLELQFVERAGKAAPPKCVDRRVGAHRDENSAEGARAG
jgi:hypothetical protein